MNKTFLIGRLTADPVCGITAAGKQYARFSLAVNRLGEGADFINITVWEKLAENAGKYLKKGKQVAITGRIQTGKYEHNGVTRQTFEVVATEMEFVGGSGSSAQKPDSDAAIDSLKPVDDDDDMPF